MEWNENHPFGRIWLATPTLSPISMLFSSPTTPLLSYSMQSTAGEYYRHNGWRLLWRNTFVKDHRTPTTYWICFFSVFLSFARRSDTRRIVDEYNNILLWGRIVCVRCAGNDDYDDDDMLSHNANPFRCSCCRFTNIYIVTESFRVAFFRFCFFFSFVFVIISYSCSCSSSSSSYSKWRAPFPLYIHQNVVTLFISSSLVHFGERSFIDVRCHFHQRGDDDEKKKRETNQKRLVPRNLIRNDTLRFLIHYSVHVIFHFFFSFLWHEKGRKVRQCEPNEIDFQWKNPTQAHFSRA